MAPYILTIGLNPVWQTTLAFPELQMGEVNRSRKYSSCCSGKGLNVTRVLHQADIAVKHLTYIDSMNGAFYKSVREQNLPVQYIPTNSVIRGCYTLLDHKGGSATEIVEQGRTVPAEAEEEMMEAFGELLTDASLVIISGSHADGFSRNIYPEMSRRTKNAGKTLILDIRGLELQDCLKYRPDLIKPNREEFCQTFLPGKNYHEVPESRLEETMLSLYKQWGISTILTNGKGSTLICYKGEIFRSQPEKLKNWVNPIGCGDAYTAGLAAEFFRGNGILPAIKRAEEFARRNAMSFVPGDIK
ncbi:MAG: hypothetical protein B6241_02260 [Spirochaetaceae bacterium 4572_59]|nr:MAG: hypothetical protein B6241_02260 [Spirochaetaceae bacterium 4572_59]